MLGRGRLTPASCWAGSASASPAARHPPAPRACQGGRMRTLVWMPNTLEPPRSSVMPKEAGMSMQEMASRYWGGEGRRGGAEAWGEGGCGRHRVAGVGNGQPHSTPSRAASARLTSCCWVPVPSLATVPPARQNCALHCIRQGQGSPGLGCTLTRLQGTAIAGAQARRARQAPPRPGATLSPYHQVERVVGDARALQCRLHGLATSHAAASEGCRLLCTRPCMRNAPQQREVAPGRAHQKL